MFGKLYLTIIIVVLTIINVYLTIINVCLVIINVFRTIIFGFPTIIKTKHKYHADYKFITIIKLIILVYWDVSKITAPAVPKDASPSNFRPSRDGPRNDSRDDPRTTSRGSIESSPVAPSIQGACPGL